jgi:hypothetical protein
MLYYSCGIPDCHVFIESTVYQKITPEKPSKNGILSLISPPDPIICYGTGFKTTNNEPNTIKLTLGEKIGNM